MCNIYDITAQGPYLIYFYPMYAGEVVYNPLTVITQVLFSFLDQFFGKLFSWFCSKILLESILEHVRFGFWGAYTDFRGLNISNPINISSDVYIKKMLAMIPKP